MKDQEVERQLAYQSEQLRSSDLHSFRYVIKVVSAVNPEIPRSNRKLCEEPCKLVTDA